MDVKGVAMTYCHYRILIGGIIAIVIGIILCSLAAWMTTSKDMDTSNYKDTIAIVSSTEIVVNNAKYQIREMLTYTVDNKNYDAQSIHNQTFSSKSQANSVAKTLKTKVIYYDPSNHSKYTDDKSGEDKLAAIFSCVSSSIVICAIISIMLKDNPIFCGYTIVQDTFNILRR